MNQKRTAIFGGSFNPIHKGHIALARYILKKKFADEVWFLISPQNPLKKDSDLLDENIRLELAKAALIHEKNIFASDFEFNLSRPSYTWNTLNALTTEYPSRKFLLTIGADNWTIFNKWAHSEDIIKHYPILIYPRKNYSVNEETLPATVHYMNAPLYPYASTDIRHALQTLKEMLPEEIFQKYLKL